MDFEIWHFIIVFLAAFFGGFVDAIAGGGGMITLPAILSIGIPPHMALATNKLQSTFGSFTAALNFSLKGLVDFKEIFIGIIWTLIGTIFGTYLVLLIDAKFLNYIIPFLLLILLIYTIFSPNLGNSQTKAKMKQKAFYIIFGFILGFYDGFFGPGTGSFWTLALVGILGLYMKKAVAHTKVLNFTSNIISLIVFIIGSQILWLIGLTMALGQILGGLAGSNMVIKKDVKFVRKILIFVVFITILKLFYSLIFN